MAEGCRVLGIDPGSRVVGFGAVFLRPGARPVLLAAGAVRPPDRVSFPERLRAIRDGLAGLIREIRPDVVAIEEVFYGKSFQSALRIGESRGVAILAAAELGVPVAEYSAALVKKSVTGNGRATKPQVQAMVARLLGLGAAPEPPDAADALAIALCHGHRLRFGGRDRREGR
ncbi:MAG: crossover junction endodeoxyribonuclease RuvC [Planctomycetes bacterium]|nr:crossover junction endodeoxyribonuclease RuvC [Planctomycetota bacterium]